MITEGSFNVKPSVQLSKENVLMRSIGATIYSEF